MTRYVVFVCHSLMIFICVCVLLKKVFPRENIVKALRTVYEYNVLPFADGRMGACNGVKPNGKVDKTTVQSREFWTGVAYSLGSLMIEEVFVNDLLQFIYIH